MNQGLGFALAALMLLTSGAASAQVYKIVDKDGNVTYTDQAPPDGAEPMQLPELSVVDTDYEEAEAAETGEGAATTEESEELTPRDLRRMYRDFRILTPANEETFWGTANAVVISWGTEAPLQPGMKTRLFIDGAPQAESQATTVALTLDRGEHSVFAELRDARGRRLVTTPTITFFIKQAAVGVQPRPTPHNGH